MVLRGRCKDFRDANVLTAQLKTIDFYKVSEKKTD